MRIVNSIINDCFDNFNDEIYNIFIHEKFFYQFRLNVHPRKSEIGIDHRVRFLSILFGKLKLSSSRNNFVNILNKLKIARYPSEYILLISIINKTMLNSI